MDPEFAEFQAHLNRLWQLYRRRVYAVFVALALLWLGATMFYKVGPDSEGVVLRLGEYAKTEQLDVGSFSPSLWEKIKDAVTGG